MNTHTPQPHNETLTKNILERIEREDITPLGRGVYFLHNFAFWTLWILSVLLGAFAVAVLIFTELNIGWEFYEMTHDNALTFFVHTLPYLWIGLLILVTLFGPYNLRQTKRGYRYSMRMIVILGFCLSILFGTLLNQYGYGRYVDEMIGARIPLHNPVLRQRESFWLQPERGFYSGTIKTIDREAGVVTILTTEGETAAFLLSFLPKTMFDMLAPNIHVRILATSTETYERLVACHLMLWEEEFAKNIGDIRERRRELSEMFEIEPDETAERPLANPCKPVPPR